MQRPLNACWIALLHGPFIYTITTSRCHAAAPGLFTRTLLATYIRNSTTPRLYCVISRYLNTGVDRQVFV